MSIVYASTSLALAAVETFVHLEPNLLPDDLVSIEAELPEEVSTGRLSLASLPRDWHGRRNDQALRRFGDEWARVGKTVGLFVPSAAIRGEWNLLVNPAHRDFPRLAMGRPKRFEFDLRMFR